MSDDKKPAPRGSVAITSADSSESALRASGRAFLLHFHGAQRALKLYPVENATTQRALDDLHRGALQMLAAEQELEIRVMGEFLFVNSLRLRLELDNYAAFSSVLGIFREFGIGALRMDEGAERREWQVLLSLMAGQAGKAPAGGQSKFDDLRARLEAGGVTHLVLEPESEGQDFTDDAEAAKQAAKRCYSQGVAVTKEVMTGARMGRAVSVKKMKRAVQSIVDQV
ncbi:MAG: hypothetical protein JF590_08010, partial [Gemmatimonadetes bacterium]|nr:hypothetical protein [Gemmatimonadota bacterium]